MLHFVAGQLLLCGKVMHYASWLGSVAAGCIKKRKKGVGKCWQTNATRTNAAVNTICLEDELAQPWPGRVFQLGCGRLYICHPAKRPLAPHDKPQLELAIIVPRSNCNVWDFGLLIEFTPGSRLNNVDDILILSKESQKSNYTHKSHHKTRRDGNPTWLRAANKSGRLLAWRMQWSSKIDWLDWIVRCKSLRFIQIRWSNIRWVSTYLLLYWNMFA